MAVPLPVFPASMILDLSRMQAIEANEELAYAVVEPGVTYVTLYKFIQDKRLKLWIDCTDPGWGSVLGNALERGVGYTPFGDHAAQLCGLEVVLANGEVIRTGMGAMEETEPGHSIRARSDLRSTGSSCSPISAS